MKKYAIPLVCGLILGCAAGVIASYLLTQNIQEEKANSFYAIANDYIENDIYEAISFFYYSSILKPDWSAPHLGLAKCFEKQHQYSQAIKEYGKAITLLDQRDIASLEVGKIKEKIQKLEAAEQEDRGK